MVVWQLCTLVQQTKLLSMSQTCKDTPSKVQSCTWENSMLCCRVSFTFNMQKNWLGQTERTHTRTLLRNAHLNTITVTKTCSHMCSRHAYLLMRQGLSEDRVELLPDSSTLNFANGQKALAREKCRIWFSYEPPLFTDFSIIDEGKVPFLMSLPQMKNLGVSLDLRGTLVRILFHTGFLKGQGVLLHRNSAGHLTLDVNEICKKA